MTDHYLYAIIFMSFGGTFGVCCQKKSISHLVLVIGGKSQSLGFIDEIVGQSRGWIVRALNDMMISELMRCQ